MSILEGAINGLASAGAQQIFTDINRQSDFRNYQRSQAQNFQNSQDAQRLAPLQTKLGMQAAGLNPVTMNTSSAPASTAAAPLGAHASPFVISFCNSVFSA